MPSDPKARRLLIALCLIEFLERLAGCFVASSLVLYLNESRHLATSQATRICGWVFGLSYAAAIGGGILIDRYLGARRATLLGLGVLCVSFFGVQASPTVPLWSLAVLFVIGNGLFKPGIVALLNRTLPLGHVDRAAGFYWFYVAVNVGGLCAPLLGSTLQARFGWAGASMMAAILMACGASVLLRQWSAVFDAPAVIATHRKEQMGSQRPDGVFFMPLAALVTYCALYAQSMSTLMIWARDCAARKVLGWVIPPTFFAAVPPAVVLIGTPLLPALMRVLASRGRQPTEQERTEYGTALTGVAYIPMLCVALLGYQTGASPLWLVSCKVILTAGEMLLLPSALSVLSGAASQERSGFVLGLSFGAQAVGFWLGGLLGAKWGQWSQPTFFTVLTLLGLGTAAAMRAGTLLLRRSGR
jgi:POT family proton-dependent oligopeptide transporter